MLFNKDLSHWVQWYGFSPVCVLWRRLPVKYMYEISCQTIVIWETYHTGCIDMVFLQCVFSYELHWSTAKKMLGSLYIFLINLMLRIPNLKSVSVHHIRFLNNTQFCVINEEDAKSISHCMRYINFVVETSSRAYF